LSSAPDPQVGERIRAERTKRGISLRSVARRVGVSASLISQIETGKCQPSVSTLYAITTCLGVSIQDVFEPVDDPPAELVAAPVAGPAAALSVSTLPHAAAMSPAEAPSPATALSPATAPSTATAPSPATAPFPATALSAAAALSTVDALAALAATRSSGPVTGAGEREVLRLDSGVTWERLGHVPGVQVDFLLVTYPPGGTSSAAGRPMRHAGAEYGYLMEGELILTLGDAEQHLTPGQSVSFASSTPHRYRNDGPRPAVGVWFVSA
jgi:transcriptional regulator with XRE-family HTH domain/quercetin dioxygenase-like cupin family protein